jgi:transmembrane sensor
MSARDTGSAARAVAAAWLARTDAGLNAREEEEFRQWLAADGANAAAWEEVSDAWAALDGMGRPEIAQRAVLELGRRRRRRRARTVGLSAAMAAAVVAAILVEAPPSRFQNGHGRMALAGADPIVIKPERRVLPDGSVAELNPGGEIAVEFNALARNVRVLRGQVNFTVVKNPDRPFVVAAGAALIRDVGTVFAVDLGIHSVDVTVTEGEVAVNQTRPTLASQTPVLVAAGNGLVVPSGPGPEGPLRAQALSAAEIERRLAWRAPRLELAGTPLVKVLVALNRSNHLQLSIGDKAIADMRISGVFRADNAEGFVHLLEANYGIKAEHRGEGLIILGRGP